MTYCREIWEPLGLLVKAQVDFHLISRRRTNFPHPSISRFNRVYGKIVTLTITSSNEERI